MRKWQLFGHHSCSTNWAAEEAKSPFFWAATGGSQKQRHRLRGGFWERWWALAQQREPWDPQKPQVQIPVQIQELNPSLPGDLGSMDLLCSFGCLSLTGQSARGRRLAGTLQGLQGPSSNPELGILMNSKRKKKNHIDQYAFLCSFPLLQYFLPDFHSMNKTPSTELPAVNTSFSRTQYCLWTKKLKTTICFWYPLWKRNIKFFYNQKLRLPFYSFQLLYKQHSIQTWGSGGLYWAGHRVWASKPRDRAGGF